MMLRYSKIGKVPVSNIGTGWIQVQMCRIHNQPKIIIYGYGQDTVVTQYGYVPGTGGKKKRDFELKKRAHGGARTI